MVTPESLRFDFSHFQKVTDEEMRRVEHLVNAKIRANIPLKEYRNIPIEEAKELGAIALFGEKCYPVRIIDRILWWYTCCRYRKHRHDKDHF